MSPMSKKKLVVDQDKCIGCNTCPLIAPDLFELDNTDFKAKIKRQPEESEFAIASQAVDSCPVGAISLVESLDN